MDTRPAALYRHLYDDVSTLVDDSFRHLPGTTRPLYKPSASVREFSAERLLHCILRKYVAQTPEAAKLKARDYFAQSNELCSRLNTRLLETTQLSATSHPYVDAIVAESAFILERWIQGPLGSRINLTSVLDNLTTGPGASIGASGTTFYEKLFAGPLTCTSSSLAYLYDLWVTSRPSELGLWRDAEIQRRDTFGPVRIVEHNNQSVVDKNVDIGRVICTEPSLNMMFQQGISAGIENVLLDACGINLSTQQAFNRCLAHDGSIDGSFATIDLKDASNRLCLALLPLLFGQCPELVWLIKLTRSPNCKLLGGEVVPMHMISSMGNGFTFSLMTMIFASLVVAVYRYLGLPIRKNQGNVPGNFGVFGDDIIVIDRAAPLLCRVLEHLGHTINSDKTFTEGNFRESCGGDYYHGHRVTGVYAKTLNSQQDWAHIANELITWTAWTGISLPSAVPYCLTQAGFYDGTCPVVSPSDSSKAGIQLPLFLAKLCGVRTSWEAVGAPVQVYTRWEPCRAGYRFKNDTLKPMNKGILPHHGTTPFLNHDGLAVSVMQGCLRDGFMAVRAIAVRYEIHQAFTSAWDSFPDPDWPLAAHPSGWRGALAEVLRPVRRLRGFSPLPGEVDSGSHRLSLAYASEPPAKVAPGALQVATPGGQAARLAMLDSSVRNCSARRMLPGKVASASAAWEAALLSYVDWEVPRRAP